MVGLKPFQHRKWYIYFHLRLRPHYGITECKRAGVTIYLDPSPSFILIFFTKTDMSLSCTGNINNNAK